MWLGRNPLQSSARSTRVGRRRSTRFCSSRSGSTNIAASRSRNSAPCRSLRGASGGSQRDTCGTGCWTSVTPGPAKPLHVGHPSSIDGHPLPAAAAGARPNSPAVHHRQSFKQRNGAAANPGVRRPTRHAPDDRALSTEARCPPCKRRGSLLGDAGVNPYPPPPTPPPSDRKPAQSPATAPH
jgi:hypothetical protein